jgi:spermidine synthase
MNTTLHWRAYATNLLSIEFLEILKSHLAAQGVVAYNATGSPDVYETAGRVFSFVRKYDTFVYASDHDFLAGLTSGKVRIWAMSRDGSRLLDPDVASDRIAVAKLFAVPFQTIGQLKQGSKRPLEVNG